MDNKKEKFIKDITDLLTCENNNASTEDILQVIENNRLGEYHDELRPAKKGIFIDEPYLYNEPIKLIEKCFSIDGQDVKGILIDKNFNVFILDITYNVVDRHKYINLEPVKSGISFVENEYIDYDVVKDKCGEYPIQGLLKIVLNSSTIYVPIIEIDKESDECYALFEFKSNNLETFLSQPN